MPNRQVLATRTPGPPAMLIDFPRLRSQTSSDGEKICPLEAQIDVRKSPGASTRQGPASGSVVLGTEEKGLPGNQS